MLFVFDENFSKRLAEGLDLLEKSNPASKIPVDVISAEKLMGRKGAEDTEIIITAGLNAVVITKDKDFKQIKLYSNVIQSSGTKVLFVKQSSKLIFFWDILIAMVTRWEEIKEKLSADNSAHVYEFDIRKGISERHF